MNPEALQDFFNYQFWAYERLWDCISFLNDEEFVQGIDYSVGSIRNHLVHVISATNRWFQRLEGQTPTERLNPDDFATIEACHQAWNHYKNNWQTYLDSLTTESLLKPVEWSVRDDDVRETVLWELLLHVANHMGDHRVQILVMLHTRYQAPTFEQDFLFYLIERDAL
ncbi:hypothetical protein MASR2M15_03840 [Anaerolineales bacterium]